MSRANAEQLLAIEHTGGVLLRAGAGSGKTFVLVEHIVYLTRNWMDQYKIVRSGTFEEFIRLKYSQIVMMTFTKKAAGEMAIRLNDKFSQLCETEGDDQQLWCMANDSLPLLLVTTIDGFCRKLIAGGYFPHLSTEAKIIFNAERMDQVQNLLDKWFREKSARIPSDILDIVIREKKQLLTAFNNIFNTPGLRLSWKKFSVDEIHPENLGTILKKSFELHALSESLLAVQRLDLPEEKERSPFEKIVGLFQATGLPEVTGVDSLRIYFDLFAQIPVLRPQTGKKKTPQHESAIEGLKALRDWVRSWTAVTEDYSENYQTKVLPWMKLCQEIYGWIEARLDPNQGMTFGDIEYFVATGLEDEYLCERIRKVYQYFIVDEFQDTSAHQFQIIQRLTGSDYSRLFCVGDAKQAIYGFRGGELSVFHDCSELIGQVRTLANNYRSMPEIIHFNNSLFRSLLPLGQEYTGLDPFSVEPEDQQVPPAVEYKKEGVVEITSVRILRDVEADGKLTTEEVNHLEAEIIADSIVKSRTEFPLEVCTVLYRRLKPSGELIRALMHRKVGFTAQFKIDLLDDPVIGIFLCLLRRKFDQSERTRDRYPIFLIKNYQAVLGIKKEISEADLRDFDLNVAHWGLVEAFRKFLYSLNSTNENTDLNLHAIETLSELYNQDQEAVMVQLLQGDNQSISLDLRSGENAALVQIMTAHASKGLEFDNVYLAGIYTNGKSMADRDMFGDLPGSFNWYMDLSQRDKRKSPLFFYEKELAKYKDFSESKRLFYVACTRAQKKISWVQFEQLEEVFSVPKNSWALGLESWFGGAYLTQTGIDLHHTVLPEIDSGLALKEKSTPHLPLFFHDHVGIYPKDESDCELAISAELSVTRLNSLVDCPRKFYLENTLKLSPDAETVAPRALSEESDEIQVASSALRGTSVHAHISSGITGNFIVPREIFSTALRDPVEWALSTLRSLTSEFELISEKPLKFKLFNFMISGVPDLILKSKGEKCTQVWDFKTGGMKPENLRHYWIQLTTYAYALFELGVISKNTKVDLVLSFVDVKKNLTKSVSYLECTNILYPIWRSQNEPWKINPEHCDQCSYADICNR
ncbi:MAG TPA: UvrD-helicase domain-containing protein [Bacteriovoracaceae bacterium]|nr:UvrD-helicase domain-containing protein [Bacteriovoracaceae bacterium]